MLMDRHGTSRVLFRNTRNGVKGFPHRNLHQIKLPLPTQYQTAIKVSGIMGAKKSVEARARHAVSGADLPEFEGENATGGTSTRASSGCWTTCWPTATKKCW